MLLSLVYVLSLSLVIFLYFRMRKELKVILKHNDQLKNENNYLHEYVFVDELTGFGNCVRYIQKINEMIDEYNRYKHIFSFVMIKIANCSFKTKSTRFIIDTIKSQTRRSDLIARFNEETLIILLPHTQLRNSYIFAKKIKAIVDNYVFDEDDRFRMLLSVDSIEDGDIERSIYQRLEDMLLEELIDKNSNERATIKINGDKLEKIMEEYKTIEIKDIENEYT